SWSAVQSCKGSSTHPRISQNSPTSELGKRTRQEVLDLCPGEPRFGAVGLPAVVDDTELEEPARSEQLHALQGFPGRCLIQLHERVFSRRPVGRSAPQVRQRDELGDI